jgi:twinkle protein
MANYVGHEACPQCGSKDNVSVYDDGYKECETPGCGYFVRSKSGSQGRKYTDGTHIEFFPLKEGKLPQFLYKERKLTHQTLRAWNVQLTKTGDKVQVQFPYYLSGVPVGAKYRTCKDSTSQNKWKEKEHAWAGSRNCKLFGMQMASEKKSKLIITEGELDCMAVWQCYFYKANVVSVGNGAKAAANNIKSHIDWVKQYDEVYLLFDNDSEGQHAAAEAVKLFPPGKAKIVNLPGDCKDPCEMVKADRTSELIEAIHNAQAVLPQGVLTKEEAKQNTLDYLLNYEQRKGVTTGYKHLDNLIGGFMPGELVTVVAGTGVGKTSFTLNLTYNAAVEAGLNTLFVPLEMSHQTVVSRLVEIDMGKQLITPNSVPKEGLEQSELEQHLDRVLAHLDAYNHVGALKPAKLIELIEYYVRCNGTRVIVLDHLHAAVNSLGEENTTKGIDYFVGELKRVALQYGITILLVSHQSRSQSDSEDCKASLSRVRGSAGIAQNSDCVLGMERPRYSNIFTVTTLKAHRLIGKYGTVNFTYNPKTLRIKQQGDKYEQTTTAEKETTTEKPRIRESDSSESSRTAVRAEDVRVHERVPPGLPTSDPDGEAHIHRSKGVFQTERPRKTDKGKALQSLPRLEDVIQQSRGQTKSEVTTFFDLRRVGYQARNPLGRG